MDDIWIGGPPDREKFESLLHHDSDAIGLLFEWSMAGFVERYLDDERLHLALLGQGVIGTSATPFDPGTAYIRFHHACGCMFGRPVEWGYVQGGMGMISFILCDIARELGVAVATGTPVSAILPGKGVESHTSGKAGGLKVVNRSKRLETMCHLKVASSENYSAVRDGGLRFPGS
jgi:phytoene dehydrogenase-like protein